VFSLYASCRGKPRYGDKTPVYVLTMPMLAALFPEARFVHVIRDGRNVALSLMEMEHGPRELAQAALYWKRHVRRGRRAGAQLGPSRYREVRYEDLLGRPDDAVAELCRFLNLDVDPSMLRYFERANELTDRFTDHQLRAHRHLALPPTVGLRDWRDQLSADDVVVVEALVGDLLGELGYERAALSVGVSERLRAGGLLARDQLRRISRRVEDTGSTIMRIVTRSTEAG
jgi:hypothetical protein